MSFAELAAYPYIALEDGSSLSVQLERLAEEMGATLNVAVRVRSFAAVFANWHREISDLGCCLGPSLPLMQRVMGSVSLNLMSHGPNGPF